MGIVKRKNEKKIEKKNRSTQGEVGERFSERSLI
jgi:hypothetical protein